MHSKLRYASYLPALHPDQHHTQCAHGYSQPQGSSAYRRSGDPRSHQRGSHSHLGYNPLEERCKEGSRSRSQNRVIKKAHSLTNAKRHLTKP